MIICNQDRATFELRDLFSERIVNCFFLFVFCFLFFSKWVNVCNVDESSKTWQSTTGYIFHKNPIQRNDWLIICRSEVKIFANLIKVRWNFNGSSTLSYRKLNDFLINAVLLLKRTNPCQDLKRIHISIQMKWFDSDMYWFTE